MKGVYCLLLLTLALVAAQECLGQQQRDAWLSASDQIRLEQLRSEGFEALFNLDYERARSSFQEVARLFPGHPAGPQFLAASLWIQTLYETRRLQASLYSRESFYSNAEDKADPRVVAQFRTWTRTAQRLAEARLRKNPRDVEALYYLGATAGLKASFAEAVERRHFAALRDGSEAVDRHRQVIKLAPDFLDAAITIGLYDYVVGSLPLPIKILAGITGARGSKKRGLMTIEQVAQKARWVRDDARTLLIVLYKREQRFAEAATHARELAVRYPRNYLFRLEVADALAALAVRNRKAGDTPGASATEREVLAIFEDLLRDKAIRETAAAALDLIHFKYGEALLMTGETERAAKEFLAATKVAGAEPGLVTMAHLAAAQAFDTAGKRSEALREYRVVLSRPNVYDAHEEARKGLREPYKLPATAGSE